MILSFIDGKKPDPRFFQEMFAFMMSMDEKNGEWNYKEDHEFWGMYQSLLTKKVEELTCHRKEEMFTPTGTNKSNRRMNVIKEMMLGDTVEPESLICGNLERKVCTEGEFRDQMVAWIQCMSKTKTGSIELVVDNIYSPTLINLPDRTFVTAATVEQKRVIQKTFADTNICWRMDQWPSKIIINGLQEELMKVLMNPAEAEIISISSEASFVRELEMTPPAEHKTSSVEEEIWSDAQELEDYNSDWVDTTKSADGYSPISGSKRSRSDSGSDNRFKLLNSASRNIIKKYKKMKTSLKLAIPCIPKTEVEIEYDSQIDVIPSSQITVDEKCQNWINDNITG